MFIIKASLILTESFIILYSDKYVFKFCFRAVEAVFNFFVESYPKTYKLEDICDDSAPYDSLSISVDYTIYGLAILPYIEGIDKVLNI